MNMAAAENDLYQLDVAGGLVESLAEADAVGWGVRTPDAGRDCVKPRPGSCRTAITAIPPDWDEAVGIMGIFSISSWSYTPRRVWSCYQT